MKRTKQQKMNDFDTTVYLSVEPMLNKLALRASRNSGGAVDFDEMKCQAVLLFMEALRKYDEDSGTKFSTFCYSYVHNGLIDFGMAWTKDNRFMGQRAMEFETADGETLNPMDRAPDMTQLSRFGVVDELATLGDDAAKLVKCIFDGFASTKGKLRLLARRWGWDAERYNLAYRECRRMYQEW